jgi:OPA family glycerol-3-phosphate transporter-like MFS transporter
MEMNENKKALSVGAVCISTYLVNYYLRNILSVMTPQMLETGLFDKDYVGLLSSTYMLLYALGQLINGFLGDRMSPKKMVLIGILSAGVACSVFPLMPVQPLQMLCFAVFGFALSMVRGPLMKIIAENTKPNHARTICVFFSFASFAGPLIASVFAMLNNWTWAFAAAGATALVVAVIMYTVLTAMEKKGLLTYKTTKGQGLRSLLDVFKIEKFVFYMVIACLVEIGAASISFWIPTYLTENLGFDNNTANLIFSGISTARSLMPFAALIIFRSINEKDVPMMRTAFAASAIMFCGMLFTDNVVLSLVLLVAALLAMSCSSALLWSIYIPGLGKTGKVSSVNGVLDCTGYAAAAAANILFAKVMTAYGWNAVFMLWASIGIIGVIATFFAGKKKESTI